jgi:hypothetical protein
MPPAAKMSKYFQRRGVISQLEIVEALKPRAEINSSSAESESIGSLVKGSFTTR